MNTKNALKSDNIKHSTFVKIIKSKFRNDNSFSYSPRKHGLPISNVKYKRKQTKLGCYSPCSPSGSNTSYHIKSSKTVFEKRVNSTMKKSGQNYSVKNVNMSIRKIEENIKQKIFEMSMRIDLENNNSEIDNNITQKISSNISNYSKKFDNDSKIIRIRKNMSSSENTNSFIHRKISSEKSFSAKSSGIGIKNSSSFSKYSKKQIKNKIKNKYVFRFIERKKLVYDSIEDDGDYLINCNEGFYIPINSNFLFVFDFVVIVCALFDIIYTPYNLSNIKCFCDDLSNIVKYIYYFIDVTYILDLLFSCFRSYYNFELKIITKNEDIIIHYLFSQFFLDFFQAIPFFSYITFKCDKKNQKCYEYSESLSQSILLLCRFIKQTKILKILDPMKNSIILNFQYKIIDDYIKSSKTYYFIKWILICFFCIYNFTSIHIFIGHQFYPNWIFHSGSQNKKLSSLYLTSFYFLMTTMTTVGYGDIVCISTIEIFYQIILLAVGVSVYSWTISNIGNYVKNQNHAAVKLDEDENMLEEIRISYPNLPFKLYNNIFQHLKSRKLRQQKYDANILINSLPYSLRNHLLFTMHAQTVKNFKMFKHCQNTDFIVKLLTNFIPLFSKKNAILIYEDQLVENIVFIKEGRCSLEASIDLESPEKSINKYYTMKFKDIIDLDNTTSNYESSNTATTSVHPQNNINLLQNKLEYILNNDNSIITSGIDESKYEKEIGKCDFGGDFEESNYQFIHIINILKNENYGSVYMLLGKPSPLTLRLKSKKGELFLLRKFDVFALCKKYPNIMKRKYKKDYSNMIEIKNKTLSVLKRYCESNGIIIPKIKPVKTSTISNFYNIKEEKNNINNNNNINNINIENDQKELIENINISKPQELASINKNSTNNIINKETFKKLKILPNSNTMSIDQKNSKTNDICNINFGTFVRDGSKKKSIENNSANSSSFIFNNFIKKDNTKKDNTIKNITTFNPMEHNRCSSEVVTFKNSMSGDSNISPLRNNVKTIRMVYVKKLKKKLSKYKKEKKYYKNLYLKKIAESKNSENPSEKKLNNRLSTNILDDISSNSSSQNSNLSSMSQEKTKTFKIDEISISPNIKFSIKSKYQNLNNFTLGEYAKNKNLRKCVKKFIANYITFEKFQKDEDHYNDNKKCSRSVSLRKSSSLPSFYFFNVSSDVSQDNIEEFENKAKKRKNKNFLNFIDSNFNLNDIINNDINNNYKCFINYSPQIEITKYNQNLNYLSVTPMKSSKNEKNNKLNLSSLRILNPNKRKFSDYELEQILDEDENNFSKINLNLRKSMSTNIKKFNKNLIILKNNKNKDKKHLTYENKKIISGNNIDCKNNKKNKNEFNNNFFMNKDSNSLITSNVCSII